MKKYILFLLASMFFVPAQAKKRTVDEEETIKKIWARTDMPEFNNRKVSDKYKDEPAVILAKYCEMTCKTTKSEENDLLSTDFGRNINSNLERCMVKINSNSAIHKFSTIRYKKGKFTVGIRLYKSDGTVVEINANDHIKLSSSLKKGKKGTEDIIKIAIPNLQKGDIIDYFTYGSISNYKSDDILNEAYPIQSYRFKGEFGEKYEFKYWLSDSIKPELGRSGENSTFKLQLSDVEPAKHEAMSSIADYGIHFRYELKNATKDKTGCSPMKRSDEVFKIPYAPNNPFMGSPYKQWAKKIKTYMKKHPNLSEEEKIEALYYLLADMHLSKGKYTMNWDFISMLSKYKIKHTEAKATNRFMVNDKDAIDKDEICPIVLFDNGFIYSMDSYQKDQVNCLWDYLNVFEGSEMKRAKEDKWEKVPVTPAEKNKTHIAIEASLNIENNLTLDVKRSVSIDGNVKRAYRKSLGNVKQWDSIVRAYYGIPNGFEEKVGMYDGEIDLKKKIYILDLEAEEQEDCFKAEADNYFVGRVKKMNSYHLDSYGLFLSDPTFKYRSDVILEGAVKKADRSKIINIGHLMNDMNLTYLKDERKSDIVLRNTFLDVYEINFKIPSGYEVTNPGDFEKNITNKYGSFISSAKVEGGKLMVNVEWKVNDLQIPAADWNYVLEIFKGYESLFNTSAILTRK